MAEMFFLFTSYENNYLSKNFLIIYDIRSYSLT